MTPGIKWISKSTYVDIETGHILTKKIANNKYKYIIIKTKKHVTINKNQTQGSALIRYIQNNPYEYKYLTIKKLY